MVAGAGASLDDFVAGTDNPIVQAAAPLLLLVARLGAVQHVSSTTLRQQAVQEIRAGEDRLRATAVSSTCFSCLGWRLRVRCLSL